VQKEGGQGSLGGPELSLTFPNERPPRFGKDSRRGGTEGKIGGGRCVSQWGGRGLRGTAPIGGGGRSVEKGQRLRIAKVWRKVHRKVLRRGLWIGL